MKIKYTTICECGKRFDNQDSWGVREYSTEQQWIGIVCDGLGGHPMGETASETIVDSLLHFYDKHRHETDYSRMIEQACVDAYQNLDRKADRLNHVQMGTTMVMACINQQRVSIAHMGDSRCYLLDKNGHLRYRTTDHLISNFGWETISRCFMSGQTKKDEPEIVQFDLSPGDRILLCSDGLYKSMPPEILQARMADNRNPEDILDVLAFLCERNGDDNYTGVLIFVE